MNAPQWARLLPTSALFPRNPNIELIEERGLLDIDETDLPAPEYKKDLHPDILGPCRVTESAKIDFRREHRKQYKQTAAKLAEKGLSLAREELRHIREEIEAISWLSQQCAKAEDRMDHQLQHRPTYSENEVESLLEYLEALLTLRRKIARVRVLLELRQEIFKKAVSHLRRGKPAESLMPTEPPHPRRAKEYLKLAYYWYRDGNRCEGDKPTELWKYLADQTGNQLSAPRERFKEYDWYDPYGKPTPADHTRKAILEEGSKYY